VQLRVSDNGSMALEITEELIARQSPEAQAIIRALLARLAELEARLNQTSRNSSVPPSSAHPHAKPKRDHERSRRQRGGQPGHRKHERPLLPPEQCTDVQELKPSNCRRCGQGLAGADPDPLRHQVWELPVIRPEVIEYRRHRLVCPGCGEATCALLPTGVPEGQSGPRLVAFAGLLMAFFRQSKRRTALFVGTLLHQPCCPALTIKMQTQVTAALRPAYEELVAELPSQPYLGIDESPTKEATTKSWLWTFVAGLFTVFVWRNSRAATVLAEALTDGYAGVVICDRAKMYWMLGRLQWCWAHLKRDFQALADSDDAVVRRLGRDLLRPTRELFRQWSRCRDGTIGRAALKRDLAPIRQQVEGLLLRGLFSGHPRLVGMCRELYVHRQWLWMFLDHEDVEPTNNASERALRHAVIWRKLSFGTQSPGGSRFVETMLTVIESCRQQGRNVFEYVTAAVQAHFAHQPTPSLLPRV
jgi:transposase